MSDPEREVRLESFVRDQLLQAWVRLYEAHRWTNRNEGIPRWDRPWSMAADSLADDIREATSLVGPVDLGQIGMEMLVSGWFARAVDRIGLPEQPVPNERYLQECRDLMRRHGMIAFEPSTDAPLGPEWAETYEGTGYGVLAMSGEPARWVDHDRP